MNKSFTRVLAVFTTAVAMLLAACVSQLAVKTKNYSGFLQDYSQFKPMKDAVGVSVMGWVSPQLTSGKYHKVIIDPVEYYPPPMEDKHVNAETLSQILEYYDKQLHDSIGAVIPIVNQPGSDVVRLRVAITAVGTGNAPLKAYQYIPIALLVQGAKTAAGVRTQDAELNTEMEVVDSETGMRLGAAVKSAHGTEVTEMKQGPEKGQEMVTLNDVKPILDKWARTAALFASKNVKNN